MVSSLPLNFRRTKHLIKTALKLSYPSFLPDTLSKEVLNEVSYRRVYNETPAFKKLLKTNLVSTLQDGDESDGLQ